MEKMELIAYFEARREYELAEIMAGVTLDRPRKQLRARKALFGDALGLFKGTKPANAKHAGNNHP
jgi:hypothetical protein